jgi:hypothetical protein
MTIKERLTEGGASGAFFFFSKVSYSFIASLGPVTAALLLCVACRTRCSLPKVARKES